MLIDAKEKWYKRLLLPQYFKNYIRKQMLHLLYLFFLKKTTCILYCQFYLLHCYQANFKKNQVVRFYKINFSSFQLLQNPFKVVQVNSAQCSPNDVMMLKEQRKRIHQKNMTVASLRGILSSLPTTIFPPLFFTRFPSSRKWVIDILGVFTMKP